MNIRRDIACGDRIGANVVRQCRAPLISHPCPSKLLHEAGCSSGESDINCCTESRASNPHSYK